MLLTRGPRQRFGPLQSFFARYQVRPDLAAGQTVSIEILRWPAVGKADLEAAAFRYGLMLDQSDV